MRNFACLLLGLMGGIGLALHIPNGDLYSLPVITIKQELEFAIAAQ